MKRTRIGIGAAVTAGVLATAGLVYAPAAAAVEPGTATVRADCGAYGGGEATLTATQDGTTATITVTSSEITTPVAVEANSVETTMTMSNGDGTTEFTGSSNPAMEAGGGVDSGPLTGTVASGDSLDAFPGSLTLVVMGISVTCDSTSAQSPGPFVFD